MRKLSLFLRAAARHWFATVTGSVFGFGGLAWEAVRWKWPTVTLPSFEPWLLWAPGIGLLFVAAFLAWRDEHDRAEMEGRALQKLREDLPRPRVTATYSAPRDLHSATHVTVVRDEFVFENLSDVPALNVSAEIQGLPDSLEAQMIWDVSVSASSVLPILRKDQPVAMSPWVVRQHPSTDSRRESSGYVKIDNTLAAELRKASRAAPWPRSWLLKITYNDHHNRTLQTICEIQVDSDLGGIITIAKEIGRVVDDPATS
ncbi:MAG: hypothetical protein HYX89_07340 [Chloroflexi bacterium]|nr:hypothetical protein [Chloroflexota bacterium]